MSDRTNKVHIEKNVRKKAVDILTSFDLKGCDIERSKGFSSRNQALLTNIVYGVLRHRIKIDFILNEYSRLPLKKLTSQILNLLRIAIYQLFFLDRIPDYAIVNESINLATKFNKKTLSGYINGMLRNIIRSQSEIKYPLITDNRLKHISTIYSHPEWMVERWLDRFGTEKTIDICKNNISIPQISIRVNTLKCSREKLLEQIDGRALPFSSQAIAVKGNISLDSELFKEGCFYIQDEASQVITEILSPKAGEKILDGCAGIGGKCFHIYEMTNGNASITAVEKNAKQVKLFKENRKRLGAKNINLVEADLFEFNTKEEYDRILLDVPCSSLGVLRRRPDAKWRKKPAIFKLFHKTQLALLTHASKLLKPGGTIVYSTCSTEVEENRDVINAFLELNDFIITTDGIPKELQDKGAFNTLLNTYNMDYMFAVKLVKSK